MGNAQIAEIYHRMKPEDQCLFRQFKRFHKHYYETHGHDAPSHQLTRGIVQQMFPGLPSADAETIAKARAELLADVGAEAQGAVQAAGDWRSPFSCRHIHHHQRHLSTHRHLNHHDFCQGKIRRGQLSNSHQKKLKSSPTSSQGGWPPHIWVPRDCCG